MRRFIVSTIMASALLLPLAAQATTVTTTLNYAANNVGLDGGNAVGFDAFTTADVGIANLRFGAKASGGDVDASARIGFSTTFEQSVSLSGASNFSVGVGLNSLNFNYSAFTGADAGAFVDFKSFAGVNLNEFRVVGDDYTLTTSDSKSGFGSAGTERATQRLAGVGPSISFGLGVRAEVNLNASQTTSMSVNDFRGTILATHESGVTRSSSFSLQNDPLKMLDLSLAGEWSLDLLGLDLRNSFDSATGLAAGYELGLAAGELFGGCGDYSIDTDNAGFLDLPATCLADTGVSDVTSQLNLLNPSPFMLDWGTKSVNLGKVNVNAPAVAAVPLPAGMPLLLAGIGGFAGLRRLKKRDTA